MVFASSFQKAHALKSYVAKLPNGGNVPDAPAVGHPDAEGMGGENEFGKAFKEAGYLWTEELCMADTDGDGFTNGQELGDPCCKWTEASPTKLFTTGISHPSDKSKKPSYTEAKQACGAAGGGGGGGGGSGGGGGGGGAGGGGAGGPIGGKTKDVSKLLPQDDDEDDSDESAPILNRGVSLQAANAVVGAFVAAFVSLYVSFFGPLA